MPNIFAEVVVDLDLIDEPMIADPDVNNADVSKRYTHDTIRPNLLLQCGEEGGPWFRWFLHGA